MSVAFRRESDEEHLEPKFELPIPPGPNLVTEAGLAMIVDKLAALDAVIAAGGPPDDPVQADARRQQRYWSTRKATAQVAPPPPGDRVAFGSHVRFALGGVERHVRIVGSDEADPATGTLAFTSPLARALIGGEPGEAIDFAGVADAIEILAIE